MTKNTDDSIRENALSFVKDIVVGVLIWLFLFMFVIESRLIPSESMVPTLLPGDRLFAEKVSLHFRPLQRGDIVVFDPPFETTDPFIKRIIGLPGETVEIKDGSVLVNGARLTEKYTNEPPTYQMAQKVVPDGQYFMLGDNRNHSNDGHVWGFVPAHNITSRAILLYWPLSRAGLLNH